VSKLHDLTVFLRLCFFQSFLFVLFLLKYSYVFTPVLNSYTQLNTPFHVCGAAFLQSWSRGFLAGVGGDFNFDPEPIYKVGFDPFLLDREENKLA